MFCLSCLCVMLNETTWLILRGHIIIYFFTIKTFQSSDVASAGLPRLSSN